MIYRIFISSVKELLEDERRMLSECILADGNLPVQMEYNFFADNNQLSLDKDKEKIKNCDCVIVILSYLQGEIISKKIGKKANCPLLNLNLTLCEGCGKDKCCLTFTEFEYYYAKKIKKPIIVILNKNYNSEVEFKKINDKRISQGLDDAIGRFHSGDRKEYSKFVEMANTEHIYPYTSPDEFRKSCADACRCANQMLRESSDDTHPGLVPFVELYNKQEENLILKSQLNTLYSDGIVKIYKNQAELITELDASSQAEIYLYNDNPQPIKILAIRGISFVTMGHDWEPFLFGKKNVYKSHSEMYVEFVLAGLDNTSAINNRAKTFSGNNISAVQKYAEVINNVHDNIKEYAKEQKCYLYKHSEESLPFRLVFMGAYLYLCVFINGIAVIDSPIIKIHKNSTLYSALLEYYNWILNNKSEKVTLNTLKKERQND